MSLVIPDSGSRIFSGCVMGRSVFDAFTVLLEIGVLRPVLDAGEDVAGCVLDEVADSNGSALSRTTSFAGLSSRRPLNAAWRTRLSRVQLEKAICATDLGLTQWTPRAALCGRSANGDLDCSSLLRSL